MIVAYAFVLWVQYSAMKKLDEHRASVDKAILDLTAEINSMRKSSVSQSLQDPKKLLVDQRSLYSLK